jgi:hypothetical protein
VSSGRGVTTLSFCFECGGDPAEAESESGLGCALGDAQHLGDLAIRLAFEVRELDRAPLLRGQHVERGAHALGGDERSRHLLDIGRGDRAARFPLGTAPPGFFASYVVDRTPVRERAQPGAQAAPLRIEASGRCQIPTKTS